MSRAIDSVIDTIDLETFLRCGDEEEGKRLALELAGELGFREADVMYVDHYGPGVRVRVRGFINKPGDRSYPWLRGPSGDRPTPDGATPSPALSSAPGDRGEDTPGEA